VGPTRAPPDNVLAVQIGFIGSGNMAAALARGWGDPFLCTDAGSGRARDLAAELGGEAVASNRELAERAELVVLAHKPAQLDAVAAEIAGTAPAVVSLLARTSQSELRRAYPGTPVFRIEPNTPVAVRRGVLAFAAPEEPVDEDLRRAVHERFAQLGEVVVLAEALMEVAGACAGVGPAYFALLVEAQVDAAVRHGLNAEQASRLVAETMAGTAEVLRGAGYDTLAVRRAVTSPGGTTARGLAALERGGVRAAFQDAIDAIVGA
jgi:pyrroline-5-carboxylate reductase